MMHTGIEKGRIDAVFAPFLSHNASKSDNQWINNKAYYSKPAEFVCVYDQPTFLILKFHDDIL